MACMARRGFLTLRNCDNPEARNCEKCGRAMCTEHLSARSGFKECLECAATTVNPDTDQNLDREWAYGFRREYYRRSGYSPIDFALAAGAVGVAGAGLAYWSNVDRRAFRQRAGQRDPNEERDPGFGDS